MEQKVNRTKTRKDLWRGTRYHYLSLYSCGHSVEYTQSEVYLLRICEYLQKPEEDTEAPGVRVGAFLITESSLVP